MFYPDPGRPALSGEFADLQCWNRIVTAPIIDVATSAPPEWGCHRVSCRVPLGNGSLTLHVAALPPPGIPDGTTQAAPSVRTLPPLRCLIPIDQSSNVKRSPLLRRIPTRRRNSYLRFNATRQRPVGTNPSAVCGMRVPARFRPRSKAGQRCTEEVGPRAGSAQGTPSPPQRAMS